MKAWCVSVALLSFPLAWLAVQSSTGALANACKNRNGKSICLEACNSDACVTDCQRPDMNADCQFAWFGSDGKYACAGKADYPASCRKSGRPSPPKRQPSMRQGDAKQ